MRRNALLALGFTIAAVAAAVVLASSASAGTTPAGTTLTLKELERGSTFTHIRNTKPTSPNSNQRGDLIILTNPLADTGGAVVGRLHLGCVTTVGARDFRRSVFTCSGVLRLRNGTLTVQATVSPGVATTTGAVTGGTGAYAGARGQIVSVSGRSANTDTITLLP